MLKSYQWGGWVLWLDPDIFVSAPGILIIVHQWRLIMFSLKVVDYSMSFLFLSTWIYFYWQLGCTILKYSYFLNFYMWPSIMLKSLQVGGGWVEMVSRSWYHQRNNFRKAVFAWNGHLPCRDCPYPPSLLVDPWRIGGILTPGDGVKMSVSSLGTTFVKQSLPEIWI